MNKKIAIIGSAAAVVLVLGAAGITYAVTTSGDDTLTGDTLERASNVAIAEVGSGTVTSAERNDDVGSAYDLTVRLDNGDEVDVELNDSFDVVFVGDYDRNDNGSAPSASAVPSPAASATAAPAPTPAAADQASAEAAALAAVGSGRVTEFDISDDADHRYEVEVTLDSGQDIDVDLDANFVVLTLNNVPQ